MRAKGWTRGLVTAGSLVLGLAFAASLLAQGMFYQEVEKDGRIYVFANGQRYEAFQKSGGSEIGVGIARIGAGPKGETIVFDSEDAINLYNFKHDKPGEVFPKPKPTPPPSAYPAGKFSGLMFGDYYWYDKYHQDAISATNTAKPEGQQGFWMRRMYFAYDLAFSEKFVTRFRMEVNSNGQFTSPSNLTPFVKDAYLKWTFTGKQQMTVGIAPTLTFDWQEGFWGLRQIEKTPADLYRIDSSRDFGLTVSGPIEVFKGLSYAAQGANDSGNGSETDKYKTVRLEGRLDRNPGIGLDAVYTKGKRPAGQDRETFSGFAGYRNATFRAGALYLWQERKSGTAAPDQKIDIWSAFGVWEFGHPTKMGDLFFRFDDVKGTKAGIDTGVPGVDGIDYLILSTAQPFKTYIFGGEWFLFKSSIRVGPNVEMVQYKNDPDPKKFPGRDQDRIVRVTFYWTF